MPIEAAVLRTIRRHDLLAHGPRVLVAVSGGADSVGMLALLRDIEATAGFVVAGIGHFNHQLRGAEADADEVFCRARAAELSLAIEVGRADVRCIAAAEGRSIEDAARRCRYAFLEAAADRLACDVIAVAHTRDDQAETFLLRILRGAGTRGLGAIRHKAGRVIRPLLDVSRAELRQFVDARGLTFREDASNRDVGIPRNRIRHELLPYLTHAFGGDVAGILAREAAVAQVDGAHLEREAIELAASLVLVDTAGQSGLPGDRIVIIDARGLAAAPPALASRVARNVLEKMAGHRFIGAVQVAAFLDFVSAGTPGSAMSLPGQQAVHNGTTVTLTAPLPRSAAPGAGHFFRLPLSVPGEVVLDPQRLALSASWAADTVAVEAPVEWTLVKDVEGPLAVRSRRPGDRLQPPGMGGRTKKLQDYLVDRKVARADRDFLPLVVDRHDRIVWVVGHGVSESFRASEALPGVILLKVRRLGGEG